LPDFPSPALDVKLMPPSDAEARRARRKARRGIDRQKEFARFDPRSRGGAAYDDVERHPALAPNGRHRSHRGVDGIGSRYIVLPDVKESGVPATEAVDNFLNAGLEFLVIGRTNQGVAPLVDELEPRPIILAEVADVDVPTANQLLDAIHNADPILRRRGSGRVRRSHEGPL